tara:strand:+ start:201 stop:506 length:306 start_codon:yes stop_codon:yes gene_type:complete
MSSERLKTIADNLIEIFIIGGKLLISYIRDGWSWIALLWKDDHLSPPKQEDDFIWNGGVTNERGSRINDTQEDNTLVYDEYTIDGNIIYDGILGDVDDDNG